MSCVLYVLIQKSKNENEKKKLATEKNQFFSSMLWCESGKTRLLTHTHFLSLLNQNDFALSGRVVCPPFFYLECIKEHSEIAKRKVCTVCCVCVFSSHPFWTSSSLDVPAGVTQEEGHTGFLIHLPSAVRALIFVARRIQPFLSLVDREVEFCVLTN